VDINSACLGDSIIFLPARHSLSVATSVYSIELYYSLHSDFSLSGDSAYQDSEQNQKRRKREASEKNSGTRAGIGRLQGKNKITGQYFLSLLKTPLFPNLSSQLTTLTKVLFTNDSENNR
jgi:hypothetical protein